MAVSSAGEDDAGLAWYQPAVTGEGAIEQAFGRGRGVDHRVAGYAQSAGQAGAEVRFSLGDLSPIEHLDLDAALAIERGLALDLGQFDIVGCDPKRATMIIFGVHRQVLLSPQLDGMPGEIELGFGVVHHDQVTHGGRGCAGTRASAFDNRDAQPFACEGVSDGASNDARSDDDGIACRLVHESSSGGPQVHTTA
jgi:hypothetical protein